MTGHAPHGVAPHGCGCRCRALAPTTPGRFSWTIQWLLPGPLRGRPRRASRGRRPSRGRRWPAAARPTANRPGDRGRCPPGRSSGGRLPPRWRVSACIAHVLLVQFEAMNNPPHPGRGINVTEAARVLGEARHTLSRVLNGHAAISPEIAIPTPSSGCAARRRTIWCKPAGGKTRSRVEGYQPQAV